MKKYLLYNLYGTIILAPIGAIIALLYLLLNPLNESEYDKYVYYLNFENREEGTYMADDLEEVNVLLHYYDERRAKPGSGVTLAKDIWYIPSGSKAKLLDTVGINVVKIELLYYGMHGQPHRQKGYVPLINLHSTSKNTQ